MCSNNDDNKYIIYILFIFILWFSVMTLDYNEAINNESLTASLYLNP